MMNPNHVLLRDFVHTTPVLCMDMQTGIWREATPEEYPPETEFPGDAPHPIRGLYVKNNGTFFFCYRNSDGWDHFRDSDGAFVVIDGTVYAAVEPATDLAGNVEPEYNIFKILRDDGQLLYQTRYEATLYRKLYETELMTSTSIHVIMGDSSIANWDIFHETVNACNYMKEVRDERMATKDAPPPPKTPAHDLCPRSGYWITPVRADSRQYFQKGQVMPDTGGNIGESIWQWDVNQD